VFTVSSIYLPLYPIFKVYCEALFVVNFITFVLSKFSVSLLALNHIFVCENTLPLHRNHQTFY
jgi:hypothetical protein